MGIIFTSEEDKKFLDIDGVGKVGGPINHVANHEVRKCRVAGYGTVVGRNKYRKIKYVCWKCEEKEDEPQDFRERACHHCTCEFCPKE